MWHLTRAYGSSRGWCTRRCHCCGESIWRCCSRFAHYVRRTISSCARSKRGDLLPSTCGHASHGKLRVLINFMLIFITRNWVLERDLSMPFFSQLKRQSLVLRKRKTCKLRWHYYMQHPLSIWTISLLNKSCFVQAIYTIFLYKILHPVQLPFL